MSSINASASVPLILALDTSSSLGSVALCRSTEVLGARTFVADRGHSRQLLPAIDSVFKETGVQQADVGLFSTVVGPGSFTGLRVALACIRGLAGNRPCFGAVGTDVAAWAARGRGRRILALTDLFHGEVFGAVHDDRGGLLSSHESGDLAPVLAVLRSALSEPPLAVGSAADKHREEISAAFPGAAFLDLPEGLAPHLASLAADPSSETKFRQASDLLPFYLRDPLTRGLLATQPKAK